MNIAIVSVTGRDVGGVAAFMSRLCIGINKLNGNDVCRIVLLTKGKALREVYKLFGVPDEWILQFNNVKDAAEHLNKWFDYVVHENPGGYGDFKSEKFPWYHNVIEEIEVPQSAVIHDPETWTKWCPWIGVYETNCTHFFSNKESLAHTYQRERGYVDVYPIDIPIDITPLMTANLKKSKLVASTHRVFPLKRYRHIIQAVQQLPEWRLSINSHTTTYFHLKNVKEMVEDCGNIELNTESYKRDLDDIYRDAALVYSASYFPEGNEGGMENVALEGSVRGAVPLVTPEWCGHPNSPPEDAVYKFSVVDENGKSNLVDILSEIDPRSEDYKTRQKNLIEFIKRHKADTVVAKKFIKILKGS